MEQLHAKHIFSLSLNPKCLVHIFGHLPGDSHEEWGPFTNYPTLVGILVDFLSSKTTFATTTN